MLWSEGEREGGREEGVEEELVSLKISIIICILEDKLLLFFLDDKLLLFLINFFTNSVIPVIDIEISLSMLYRGRKEPGRETKP